MAIPPQLLAVFSTATTLALLLRSRFFPSSFTRIVYSRATTKAGSYTNVRTQVNKYVIRKRLSACVWALSRELVQARIHGDVVVHEVAVVPGVQPSLHGVVRQLGVPLILVVEGYLFGKKKLTVKSEVYFVNGPKIYFIESFEKC